VEITSGLLEVYLLSIVARAWARAHEKIQFQKKKVEKIKTKIAQNPTKTSFRELLSVRAPLRAQQ